MQSAQKIKRILYSIIEETGKKNIHVNIISSIEASQKYIDTIIDACMRRLKYESTDRDLDITIAILCEALLHFMLTVSTLPSERKVEIRYGLTIDVVIPNLLTLKTRPDKSIIVQIIKDVEDFNKISQLEFLQPNSQNIWVISSKPFLTTRYTEYMVFPNFGRHKYSHIIIDINKFLTETGDNSFRFVHSRF